MDVIYAWSLSLSTPLEQEQKSLAERLAKCQPGQQDWREFEQICLEILTKVFVPPLREPEVQSRTITGRERRDALFPLIGAKNGWEDLSLRFESHFLFCEFRNYSELIDKDVVNQTRNYLRKHIGHIGIIFSRKGPSNSALNMQRSAFTEEQKIILLFEDRHLIELLKLKEARQDPFDLIRDAVEKFLLSYD